MLVLRESAPLDTGPELLERGDALLLQRVVLGAKVAIDLRVPWLMAARITEHVFSEQILRIAARARAHRHENERRALRNLARHAGWNDLDLGRDRPPSLELSPVMVHMHRFGGGLAHRRESAAPCRPCGDEPDMADDRNSLGCELRDRVEAAGAIEGV